MGEIMFIEGEVEVRVRVRVRVKDLYSSYLYKYSKDYILILSFSSLNR
jgi:hypothetical protein